ncbi:MAG: DsrE family protein [Nitrososphaerota archaeon]|nr:DsrE family protein [Nitrososphaerota archaeon]MDG7023685.1 DsrE family protein [Nitrososphaerota archaeon]
MSGKVAILATMSPAETARVDMMFEYSAAAAAMDFEVLVFLSLDSVLILKKGVYEKLGPATRDRISRALSLGVKIAACSAAMQGFGVKEFGIDGVEVRGAAYFFDYVASAKTTLTL